MKATISPEDLNQIRRHGESSYPHECCGFLLGAIGEDQKTITATVPVDNERTDSARNRYLISPDAYWEGEKEARRRGLEIIGIYHSHPDHPARPSDYDLEHALPWLSYIIVAVKDGRAQELNSFVLSDGHTQFEPEQLSVL